MTSQLRKQIIRENKLYRSQQANASKGHNRKRNK